MKGALIHLSLAALAALSFHSPVAAQSAPQGPIGTVEQGLYVCELPGDAAGPRGIVQEEAGFVIESASRYSSAQGSGTYLRRGNVLAFTSGARSGERYHVVTPGFLRKIEDDKPGRLRCVHQ